LKLNPYAGATNPQGLFGRLLEDSTVVIRGEFDDADTLEASAFHDRDCIGRSHSYLGSSARAALREPWILHATADAN